MATRPHEHEQTRSLPQARRLPLWAVRVLWTFGLVWLLSASWPRAHTLGGRTYLVVLSAAGILAGWQQAGSARDG